MGANLLGEFSELEGTGEIFNMLNDLKENFARNFKVSISNERLEELESNEFFSQATQTGFSKDTIKQIVTLIFDYIIENSKIKQLSNTKIYPLIQGILDSTFGITFNVETLNGDSIFESADSMGKLDSFASTKFKKQIIFEKAIDLTITKKNISFNTAIKRAITLIESEDCSTSVPNELKEKLDIYVKSIDTLIDFCIKNEFLILLLLLKSQMNN